MNEADLRGIRATLDDYASRSADQRDELPTRVFVNHTRDLLAEVERYRNALERIASEDFRGNESWSRSYARKVLEADDGEHDGR
jgi:hypothetical protein